MDEQQVVDTVRRFIEEKKFPKICPKCNHRYETLAEYLLTTTHLGNPYSYDAEENDWQPHDPRGTFSWANCPCGTTLLIDSAGMPLITMWRLMRWVKKETARRGISFKALLVEIRNEIDRQVLGEKNAATR